MVEIGTKSNFYKLSNRVKKQIRTFDFAVSSLYNENTKYKGGRKIKSNFEKAGGSYIEVGDYLLPEINLTEGQDERSIGVWGQRRRRYLKEHHRVLYYNLLTSCKLHDHLADVDEQANELFSRLVKQLAEKEGVSEKLKADDMMLWVQRMNNIRACAEEVVMNDLIYA